MHFSLCEVNTSYPKLYSTKSSLSLSLSNLALGITFCICVSSFYVALREWLYDTLSRNLVF